MIAESEIHISSGFIHAGLSQRQMALWLLLRKHVNKSMICWLRQRKIAKILGWDVRDLRRTTRELQQKGLLAVNCQFYQDSGGQACNEYRVLEPAPMAPPPPGITSPPPPGMFSPPLEKKSEASQELKDLVKQRPQKIFGSEAIQKQRPGNPTPPALKPQKSRVEPEKRPETPESRRLSRHWEEVFLRKRGVPAHLDPLGRHILGKIVASQGLPGAMAAAALWFEREVREGFESFPTPWSAFARDENYGMQPFERSIYKITQHRSFASLANKFREKVEDADRLEAASIDAKASGVPGLPPGAASLNLSRPTA